MKSDRKDLAFNIAKILVFGGIIIALVAPVSYVFTDNISEENTTK